jgi:hypothetical protein
MQVDTLPPLRVEAEVTITPVFDVEMVSELRCEAVHHQDEAGVEHECTVKATAHISYTCESGHLRGCNVCSTIEQITRRTMAQTDPIVRCDQCVRPIRVCWSMTPIL